MERFPIELLIYGVLFAVIVLFNYVARRAARQGQQPREEAPEYAEDGVRPPGQPEARYEAPAEFWGVHAPTAVKPLAPAPVHRAERPRPPDPPLLRRKRYTRQSLLGSKRELRRAIVLMTVLGPCRASERDGMSGRAD